MTELKTGQKVLYVPDSCHDMDTNARGIHLFEFVYAQKHQDGDFGYRAGDVVPSMTPTAVGAVVRREPTTGEVHTMGRHVVKPVRCKKPWPAVVEECPPITEWVSLTNGSADVGGLVTSQLHAGQAVAVLTNPAALPTDTTIQAVDYRSGVITLSAKVTLASPAESHLLVLRGGLQLTIKHPRGHSLHYRLGGPHPVVADPTKQRPHSYHAE